MMKDAILNSAKQFEFNPVIVNEKRMRKFEGYVVCGMGGSQLGAALLRSWNPSLDIIEHRDYGLREFSKKEMKSRLWIFSSYSGTTEEVLDGYKRARKLGLNMAAIAAGGTLIDWAKKDGVPYVEIPKTGIQPRSALGFSIMCLLKLMKLPLGFREARVLCKSLDPSALKKTGEAIARQLKDRVPVIYSSTRNRFIAYNWKIKLNETGKIPAFFNVVPELNHNEMNGFDAVPSSKHLSERFAFIFIVDDADHPRNKKRMTVLKKLYEDRGLPVIECPMKGKKTFEKMFISLITADWIAVSLADMYGLESEQVPMVEEFKRLIK